MIIGLMGKAGSGKSTVAGILQNSYGFKRMKFSGPLKDMLRAVGFTEEQLEGNAKEKVVPFVERTPRYVMQTLGTEWGRDLIHPNLWVNLAERSMLAWGPLYNFVFEDVRFDNEVAMISRYPKSFLWKIERPDIEQKGHVSEQGLDSHTVDGIITNDSDLLKLNQYVETAHKICEYQATQL